MDMAVFVVSLLALAIAGVSARNAVLARRASEAARDEAVAANVRAETPRLTVECDGVFGNSLGLRANLRSDRDLDSIRVSLAEGVRDGHRSGFQGLWADQVANMPAHVTSDGDGVLFTNVEEGRVLVVVAKDVAAQSNIPATASLTFRFDCAVGERRWTVTASSGEFDVHYSSA